MRIFREAELLEPLALTGGIKRRKPRSYVEWKTLRRWQALPEWEETPPGYLLRLRREEACVTQTEMGRRLGCSQQAIARTERWSSNPTVALLRSWARALGSDLEITLRRFSADS